MAAEKTVRRVVVAETALAGVRLAHDGTIEGTDEYAELLAAFSPLFVAFPDATNTADDARTPFDGGPHDYHPRAVESFLRPSMNTVFTVPTGLWKLWILALAPFVLVATPMVVLVTLNDRFPTSLAVLTVAASILLALGGALARRRTPPTLEELISLVGTASTAGPEPDRRTTGHLSVSRLSSASPLARQAAWDAYRSEVVPNDAAYPRVIYARSLRVGRDLYLQYWQFYPFNDWHNWHEADWEVVMIRFVPLADDHWKAAAAIYSSHLGGLWRPWQDVEHVATQVRPAGLTPDQDAAHPVVYVARGSHAQYFAAVPDGYPASLTQSFGPARFSFSTDWSDVVVSSSNAQDRVTYGLRAFPRHGEHMTVESRAWPRWWWLRYLGRWGAHEGIFGPTAQLDKWAAPDVWAASSCVGDPGSWKLLGGSDR